MIQGIKYFLTAGQDRFFGREVNWWIIQKQILIMFLLTYLMLKLLF